MRTDALNTRFLENTMRLSLLLSYMPVRSENLDGWFHDDPTTIYKSVSESVQTFMVSRALNADHFDNKIVGTS